MNVNALDPHPSLLWYLVISLVLLFLVVLVWILFKYLSVSHSNPFIVVVSETNELIDFGLGRKDNRRSNRPETIETPVRQRPRG